MGAYLSQPILDKETEDGEFLSFESVDNKSKKKANTM